MQLTGQSTSPVSQEPLLEDTLKAFIQSNNQGIQELKDAAMANTYAIVRLEGQLCHVVGEFNRIGEVVRETINKPSLEYPTLEVQVEKRETTDISFPNSSSLSVGPFILDNHSSMPSSYNHPPQEPLVQHFSTAHIVDFEKRVNQLMAARHAHTQPPHTYAHHQSCSICYHPSHQDDCPFISHYVIEANKYAHEHVQTTIYRSEEVVEEIFCEPSLEDPLEERFDRFGGDLDLDKLHDHTNTFSEPSLEDPLGEHFDQIGCNLDLDKFLKQAVMFKEPSLEDPLEESFAHFEFDLDLDMIHEQAKALLEPTLEMRTENGEKEN